MTRREQCTKCGGTEFSHFEKVDDLGEMNGAMPMALDHSGLFRPKPIGLLEAYACKRCGLVEFYVIDPSELP